MRMFSILPDFVTICQRTQTGILLIIIPTTFAHSQHLNFENIGKFSVFPLSYFWRDAYIKLTYHMQVITKKIQIMFEMMHM